MRAFVALGSNLGMPSQQIRSALAELAHMAGVCLLRASSLYRTTPVGSIQQPDFINAVAELDTVLAPLLLLQRLLRLEARFGRVRAARDAPRILDLDILWYQDLKFVSDILIIPHPRMVYRAFVMIPLAQIAPELMLGEAGTAQSVAAKLDGSGVRRLPE